MSRPSSICLVLASRTLAEDLRVLEQHRSRVDLAELRVDHLSPAEAAAAGRLPRLAGLPMILTVRRTRDGGRFDDPEAQRVALITRLLSAGFTYVDLEDDLPAPELDAAARAAGVRIIRSFHDFAGVPPDLSSRVAALPRKTDEIAKAAVTPRTCRELVTVLESLARPASGPRVVLGMGEVGFPTRALAGLLGSTWSYASPTDAAVAPGQVTPAALEDTYRFRSVTPATALYGVIGNPVMHSRSPMIHNRGFAAAGIDAVYVPFPAPDLDGFWDAADLLRVRGLSVTVPHKTSVLGPRVQPDEEVRAVGACNTLVRGEGTGPWRGTNTDGDGFLAPLRAGMGGRIPAGLRATVIGAGGAARSVVRALTRVGARVLVLNRTREKADALAQAFGMDSAGLDEEGIRRARDCADLIVQTTSAGMTPREEEDPVPGLAFDGRELVYELVYAPRQTVFVRRALKAGCRVIYGRQMLLAQAALQFQQFAGVPYPPGLLAELEQAADW